MKYEPKTTAEQRRELVQYLCNVNHRGAKVQRICDDLAACEAALAEEQARIAELEAMVREVIDAGNASYGKLDVWHTTADKAIALLNQEERKDGAK